MISQEPIIFLWIDDNGVFNRYQLIDPFYIMLCQDYGFKPHKLPEFLERSKLVSSDYFCCEYLISFQTRYYAGFEFHQN